MKKILLLIFTLLAFSVQAQFNLDKSYQIQDGDILKVYALDTAVYEGTPGLYKQWDFSKNLVINYIDTKTYKSYLPSMNSSFKDANFSFSSKLNNDVAYYKSNDNEFSVVGVYMETLYGSDTIKSFQINNPPQQYYNFPVEYNKIQNSSSEGITKNYYQTELISTVYRKSTTSNIIDAHGSIMLPDNKFYDDVVRVKTVQILTDSSNAFGSPGMETIMVSTITTYNFYAKNNRNILLGISYMDINTKTFMGNQTRKVKSVNLYGDYTINGLEDEVLSFNNLIYPNPAESNSYISIADNINKIEIYNNIGTLEYVYDGNDRKIELPLKSGIYLVKAIGVNNKVFSSKLIVK